MVIPLEEAGLEPHNTHLVQVSGHIFMSHDMLRFIERWIHETRERAPLAEYKSVSHRSRVRRKHRSDVVLADVLNVLVGAAFKQLDNRGWFPVGEHWPTVVVNLTQELRVDDAALVVLKGLNNLPVTPIARWVERCNEPTGANGRHAVIRTYILSVATQPTEQVHEVLVRELGVLHLVYNDPVVGSRQEVRLRFLCILTALCHVAEVDSAPVG